MILSFTKSSYTRITHKILINNVLGKIQQRLLNISCQVERLTHRSLVRVSGSEVTSFLQGIVTNDMKHFQDSHKCLFTMFLNTKGRVLYDSIIYKSNEQDTYFIECDRNGLQELVKHLKMYRVRRKINVDSIDDEWNIWVLFNPKEVQTTNSDLNTVKQEQIVPCTFPNSENKSHSTFLNEIILSDSTLVYTDPRISCLGNRVLAPSSENVRLMVEKAGVNVETLSPLSYRTFRYRLGVGEGIEELPIGKCFPLEANCDYLHGVSFHKGCYIGQELTARTHHTGVVRKRLMPLILHSELTNECPALDTLIEAVKGEKKTVVGKLRGAEKDSALGLMRIAEALETNTFTIGNIEGETLRPFWWPQELPKDKAQELDYKMESHTEAEERVFKCTSCGLSENYDYKGKKPPFSKLINLTCDSYVMKDPFSPPNKGQMLVLGSDCSHCHQPFCQSPMCSFFFSTFYCLPCARINVNQFPPQLQQRLVKSKT